MSESDGKNDAVDKIADALQPAVGPLVQAVPPLWERLRRIAVPGQIIIATFGLAFAFYHGWYWNKISTELNRRIQSSLKERLDNTVWQHKGLAGYLLSEIDSNTADSDPSTVKLSDEITSTINLIGELTKPKSQNDKKQANGATDASSSAQTNSDDKSVVSVREEFVKDGQNETQDNSFTVHDSNDKTLRGTAVGQALIMSGNSFFLFIPATAIRREAETYDPFNSNAPTDSEVRSDTSPKPKATPDPLEIALKHNPDIVRDLYLVKQLIRLMPQLDKGLINEKRVVQSYFITESGMILIRSSHKSNQGAFYKSLFNPYHHFTDRAYFWGAIKTYTEGNTLPPRFTYASEPYIDLGGHGLIRTYSRAFPLPNRRFGVLCVDISENKLMDKVRERLKVLQPDDELFSRGAEPQSGEVSLRIGDDGIKGENPLPEDFQWFSQLSKEKNISDLIGKIAAQEDTEPPQDSILRYTIPLSSELEDGDHRVNLMWVRIDFNRLWQKQTWHLIFMCIGIGLAVMFTINLFQDYFLLKKEIAELAQSIDRVMADSKNPYLRLNSENKFVNVNKEFVKLLGYGNDAPLVGEGRTFRSILSSESQAYYDTILKKSESGELTDVYSLTLLDSKDKEIKVQLHGERIVFPAFRRKKYPHRFGIILIDSEKDRDQSSADIGQENKYPG